ncbi:MAG: hypothetical protein UU48_C0007G0033 [Candidatus Uhrbacteria bacterium GW2011_GWF2_41_16]|uniref:Uncharacterized protein n=2 Tax=Candidatus Uhriibacteriota TaxID=1752732 RepID=A0A0G0XM79_9BACT|nr:MAG: hypothetical protein UU35_C0005G0026 [Candidatus Uhrbacteria bacterium GW2011_GWC2_41_11]KKR97900.1 MAG: hypothetical protein UU48_C0007G0033 [Candidatus Uhrbacteria bacterium GW2011_GWF2_41_16]HBO99584.1 hypothetical protein [Candidatus Uhrbacteria bacterium]
MHEDNYHLITSWGGLNRSLKEGRLSLKELEEALCFFRFRTGLHELKINDSFAFFGAETAEKKYREIIRVLSNKNGGIRWRQDPNHLPTLTDLDDFLVENGFPSFAKFVLDGEERYQWFSIMPTIVSRAGLILMVH